MRILEHTCRMADSNSPAGEVQNVSSASDITSSSTLVPSAFTASSNSIACEAITSKLTEVSKIAESLDFILRDLQEALDEEQASLESVDGQKHGRGMNGNGSFDVSILTFYVTHWWDLNCHCLFILRIGTRVSNHQRQPPLRTSSLSPLRRALFNPDLRIERPPKETPSLRGTPSTPRVRTSIQRCQQWNC